MRRVRRVEVWGSSCLLLFLLGWTTAVWAQQTYEERRIQELVDIHAAERLARLETRLDSIYLMGEGLIMLAAGQLIVTMAGSRKRGGG